MEKNEITLNELNSEKRILKESIEKSVLDFHQKYGVLINGDIRMEKQCINKGASMIDIDVSINISL